MIAEIVGGPYDGLSVTADQVNRVCMSFSPGGRSFIAFPAAIETWEAVLAGKVSKDAIEKHVVYERLFTPSGVRLVLVSPEQFNEALSS